MKNFLQAYQKELFYLGIAIIVIIIIMVARNKSVKELEVTRNPDVDPPRRDFNSIAEAKMIHDELSGWNTAIDRRIEVFAHILNYNENELIEVHNAYLKLYRSSNKKTLAELVRGEWIITPGEWFGKAKQYKDEILQRLRKVGAA